MQRPDWLDRFWAWPVELFLRVFGLALAVDVAVEVASGGWSVHAGRFYPWRHLGFVPLYPPAVLAVEWALRAAAGLALVAVPRKARVVAAAVRLAAPVLFVAMLQRYSNHGVLLFLVACFLALAVIDVAMVRHGHAPAWYATLRLGLTAAVVLVLIVALAMLPLAQV